MRLSHFGLLALVACGTSVEERTTSANLKVKAKSGQVWGQDLANALDLHRWELCQELGTVDCIEDAHRITLGGVEPARLGIDEPLDETSVSAPIAADRVAIAACSERLERDGGPTPVVFGPVLDDNTPRARKRVAEALVLRILGREGTRDEVQGLVDLYDELAPLSANPVNDWAVGACVVVATSVEALFY